MRISDWSSDVCSSDLVKFRLGIDYDSLSVDHPGLVYASISGFGQTGPYAKRPGFDQIAQGMSGLMSVTGLPGEAPMRVGIPIGDLCAGIFAAQGVLVALLERESSGKGQWLHTSLFESRSEEHTSELQSLMRSSYAVFC